MNGIAKTVADNLRQLRSERGVTLTHLASVSGVSKQTLSQLERGKGNPTVETVWSIAQGMGVPISRLLEPKITAASVLIRAGDAPTLSGQTIDIRVLTQFTNAGRCELLAATLTQANPRTSTPHQPGTVESVIVIAGELEAGLDGNTEYLGPGDFLTFPGDLPHAYRSLTDESQVAILMQYPPLGTAHAALPAH